MVLHVRSLELSREPYSTLSTPLPLVGRKFAASEYGGTKLRIRVGRFIQPCESRRHQTTAKSQLPIKVHGCDASLRERWNRLSGVGTSTYSRRAIEEAFAQTDLRTTATAQSPVLRSQWVLVVR